MAIVAKAAELPPRHGHLAAMALGALGVVYGDIGTSPLYTFKTAIQWAGSEASPREALKVRLSRLDHTRPSWMRTASGTEKTLLAACTSMEGSVRRCR